MWPGAFPSSCSELGLKQASPGGQICAELLTEVMA